jgi:chemotaxis response regulator CheB
MAVNTNMRVLIVDDFSTMRRIIKNILDSSVSTTSSRLTTGPRPGKS